jgi:DNA repair protein RecN (Recombination protein N)
VREIAAAGRSTARIDDETVTAARLAQEVGSLVEIHGQHDQGRLLDERWQRDLLDAFGEHGDARSAVAAAVAEWRENRSALEAAALDPREVARRLDVLDHEASEIAAANLKPGEADEIGARLVAAQHGEAIARGAQTLRDALTAEGGGARDATATALHEARALARLDPRFEALVERLAGLEAELTDVATRPVASPRASTTTRDRSRRSTPGSGSSTAWSGAMATTRRRSSSTASAPPPKRSGSAASMPSAPGARPTTPGC